ncbi:uncharacterized protein MCAP_0864-like [Haliotis cracherodii]|uniref:uncharacterized protein MCAP_0864-like n=1 Tax=Haliotis cracherodii TaxID=6455 RepID=UPI0039ECCF1D
MDLGLSQSFVSAVMATSSCERVKDTSPRRKRTLSADDQDSEHKKVKSDHEVRNDSDKKHSEDKSMTDLVNAMHSLTATLTKKMDTFEKHMIKRMEETVNIKLQEVREDMKCEIKQINNRISKIDSKQSTEIDNVNKQLNDMKSAVGKKEEDLIKLNLIFRNVIESEGENVKNKVNSVLKDGMRLKDVDIVHAERKSNREESRYPGVIVATCRSMEDKSLILQSKSKLQHSRNFKDIFIMNDKTRQQRLHEANLKTIAIAIGNEKVRVRGARLQVNRSNRDNIDSNRHRNAWPQSEIDNCDDNRARAEDGAWESVKGNRRGCDIRDEERNTRGTSGYGQHRRGWRR